MTELDAAKEKIRKLLAVGAAGSGATEEEAVTALRMARRLMEKYKLRGASLQEDTAAAAAPQQEEEASPDEGGQEDDGGSEYSDDPWPPELLAILTAAESQRLDYLKRKLAYIDQQGWLARKQAKEERIDALTESWNKTLAEIAEIKAVAERRSQQPQPKPQAEPESQPEPEFQSKPRRRRVLVPSVAIWFVLILIIKAITSLGGSPSQPTQVPVATVSPEHPAAEATITITEEDKQRWAKAVADTTTKFKEENSERDHKAEQTKKVEQSRNFFYVIANEGGYQYCRVTDDHSSAAIQKFATEQECQDSILKKKKATKATRETQDI
jgi:hypothetical protein